MKFQNNFDFLNKQKIQKSFPKTWHIGHSYVDIKNNKKFWGHVSEWTKDE